MKYFSGEDVCEGDEVRLDSGSTVRHGIVIKVIVAGSLEATEWGAPEGGVLIEGGGLGLSLTARPAEDPDARRAIWKHGSRRRCSWRARGERRRTDR